MGQVSWCWYSLPHLDYLAKHFRPFLGHFLDNLGYVSKPCLDGICVFRWHLAGICVLFGWYLCMGGMALLGLAGGYTKSIHGSFPTLFVPFQKHFFLANKTLFVPLRCHFSMLTSNINNSAIFQ